MSGPRQYRKRPVVIEAMQLEWSTWDKMCKFAGVGRLILAQPEGCWIGKDGRPRSADDGQSEIGLRIPTLEGVMIAREGDWVIRGLAGELYPCKPEIFDASYEAVDD